MYPYAVRLCTDRPQPIAIRIRVWGDPLQTNVCELVCTAHAHPIRKKGGGLSLKPLIVPAAEAFIPNGDALRNTCPPCAVGLRTHKPLFFRQPSTAAVAALFSVMEFFFHTIPISHRHISLYTFNGCAQLAHTRELQCYIWLLLS
jgi:hypothetical protein